MIKSKIHKPNTYLYFSYGTNMLSFRLSMLCKTVRFVSIGRIDWKLEFKGSCPVMEINKAFTKYGAQSLVGRIERIESNYGLDFYTYSALWGGPTPTIVPTANAHVWGVIWRINTDEIDVIDYQKAVEVKKYYIKNIPVLTPYMGTFKCRAYIQKVNPLPKGDNDEIPIERWPSWSCREVMILAAIEHGLPEYYIKYLKQIKHNGDEGCFRMVCLLDRYAQREHCECRVPGRIPRKPLKLDLHTIRGKTEK